MFHVWDEEGVAQIHKPSATPIGRKIRQVQPTSPIHVVQENYGRLSEENQKRFLSIAQIFEKYKDKHENKPPEKVLFAEQIMSSPVLSVQNDAKVKDVRKLFREHRFRHIPVLNNSKRVVGIVSDRDLHEVDNSEEEVKKFMSTPVLTAHAKADIRLVAKTMFEERVGAIPIINDENEIVGMLTRSDILYAVINHDNFSLWA